MSRLGSLYIELGSPEGELNGCTCEVGDWAADEIRRLLAAKKVDTGKVIREFEDSVTSSYPRKFSLISASQYYGLLTGYHLGVIDTATAIALTSDEYEALSELMADLVFLMSLIETRVNLELS